MKRLVLLLVVGIFLVGCSGGGSNSGSGNSTGVPYIQLSLDTTVVKRGTTVWGTVSWNDTDGDITTLHVEEYFGPSRWDFSYPASQIGIKGVAGSTRFYITSKSNASPGIHVTKFFLRDARGQQSNIIEINVQIYAMGQAMEQEIKTQFIDGLSR